MKICIIIPTLQCGGAERIASSLANDFVRKGISVAIITFDNNEPSYKLDAEIQTISIYMGKKSSIKNLIKRVVNLRKTLKKVKPDIILAFFIKTAIYALIARSRKFKIIGLERSNPYYQTKGFILKLAEKMVLPLADGFVFLTPEAQEYYSPIIQQKSTIIPNGIFIENIVEDIIPFKERKLYEICAIGRLHPVKDYVTMIKAFKIFSDSHPLHILRIFGDGIERKKLESLVNDLNLNEKVIFMGQVENIGEYIYNSGMYILTSLSESWCNALMEALASGIPSIATDCDFGPRAMIKNEINGILVPVGDERAIAKAMCKIADDLHYAKSLSENAVKIRDTHNASRISSAYYNYIEKVLS